MEQNETSFESIQSEYRRKLDCYKTQEVTLKAKIERLKRKQERNNYPRWTDHFVRPVMDELARLTPEIEWELKDTLNTFGLRGECPIFGKTASGRTIAITFTCDYSSGTLYYDTGMLNSRFKTNTLGDLNGYNNVIAPVENMQMLVDFVRRQTTPLGVSYDFIAEGERVRCTVEGYEGEYTILRVEKYGDNSIYADTRIQFFDGRREFFAYPHEIQALEVQEDYPGVME